MRSPLAALGPVVPMVQQSLGIGESHIGWLGALPMLMFALGSLISPAIGKRFGLENTLIASLIAITLGIVFRSIWASWLPFLFATLLFSLAIGFTNTLAAPVIKQRTPEHIALMTSIYSLTMTLFAGSVAGVVYPLATHVGWQWSLGIWAIVGMIAVAVWVWLRMRLGSSHHIGNGSSNPITETATPKTVSVWTAPLAWQLAIFMGLQSLLFYTMVSFLPSIWLDKGLTPVQAGHMATIYFWMAPVTIVAMTWLIKRGMTASIIAIGSSLVNVIGVAGIAYAPLSMAWLWSGLIGVGCAGIFTLCILLFSLRTDTPNEASRLSGMAQTVGYVIAFFGPLGAGWLHDHQHSWDLALLLLLVLMVINVGVGWLVGRPVMLDGREAGRSYGG